MPPPIGVVSGPLMPMRYSRNASTVSSGSQLAGLVERLLAREHLLPLDRLAVLRRRRVDHELRGGPDVDAGAVTLDEGDDRLVGDVEPPSVSVIFSGIEPAPARVVSKAGSSYRRPCATAGQSWTVATTASTTR